MRIILVFLIGLILSFYLSEVLARIWRASGKVQKLIQKDWNIHHSKLGLLILVAGIGVSFFGQSYFGSPYYVFLSTFLIGSGIGMMAHHLMSESFIFSEQFEKKLAKKHETKIERFLEILPGALTWIALTTPIWMSFVFPFAVAYLILLADIYWLTGAFRISILIYIGYNKMEEAKKINWLERLEKDFPDEWQNYYHLVVLPTYNEPPEVLVPACAAVVSEKYPKDKLFLGVGFEERRQQKAPEQVAANIKAVEDFNKQLAGVFATIHPAGLPGEVPGPATNRNWIIQNAIKELAKRGIKPEQVIVTTLDADFVMHPQFLAGALHKYLSTPADVRMKRSFTGCFLYTNNYWQAPTPMRVIATGTAFWQLSEMVGSDKYINFSSLSINLKSLQEIGGWIPDKVNDDSGFFWKAYYHFKGDYKVIPHFLPISGDAVLDVTLWKTFQNQYLQLKRWAYGVEHIPFIVTQYFKTDMNFWDKTDKLLFIFWSYFKWGTLALFITFGGLLIPVINPAFSESVVSRNLNVISSWILTIAFIGLFTTVYVNEKAAPPRPKNWPLYIKVWSYLQWALVPIVLVTITTFPAIDAQTSLMLGRYIEFRTTNKARANL